MRLEAVKRDVEMSPKREVARATIKATPKIFDMFANDTYANKPVAIMRELVANGIDAHRAAGRPDRPVDVHLPSVFDPTCRIRDFCTGMAHDFVMGPFMAYTDGSTKDKDDSAIGGFGIGSKSPFAYVDQFTLRVVHDGVLSVYTMFKDEDGIPAIGLEAQTTSDEPNGVEVSFPVEATDVDTFVAAAQEALQYFQPMPLITNGTITPPDYTYVGTEWAMRPKAGELGVIMGGVRYPVTSSSLSQDVRIDAKTSKLLNYGIDLTLPIGSCGVAMSREQLSYIPKTSVSIKAALIAIYEDVAKTFATYFDNDPSEWDAMRRLADETGMNSYSRSGRAQLLMANARYRGAKLDTSFRLSDSDLKGYGLDPTATKFWRIPPKQSRRGQNCPPAKWGSAADLYGITPGEIETVVIDDLPQSPKSKTMGRIKAFVEDKQGSHAVLVVRADHSARAVIALRNPTSVIYTSTLPEPTMQAKVKNTRPRVRMFTFTGSKDRFTHSTITNLTPSNSKQGIVEEVPYVNQPATGIMVVMNAFDLPADFTQKMATKLVRYNELHFVNIADAPKIKNAFENFEDVFAARLAVALAKYPELPSRIALSRQTAIENNAGYFGNLFNDKGWSTITNRAKSTPFGRLFELWREYVQPLDAAQLSLAPFVKAALPAGANPEQLGKGLEQQKEVLVLLRELDMRETLHRQIFFKIL